MAESLPATKRIPLIPIIICVVVAIGLVIALLFFRQPVTKPAGSVPASPEARAYVSNLRLSDVGMEATENFMKQQVVEVKGKITNSGPRRLESVDVYCLFYSVDGREIYSQRSPIVEPKAGSLEPRATRSFRLAFDSLPDGWNQTMPKLVIAQIKFSK